MPHVLLALRAHHDIAKLELEDGLVRQLAVDRIAASNGIKRISIDLPQEASPVESGLTGTNTQDLAGLLSIDAQTLESADIDGTTALLSPLISHVAAWTLEPVELATHQQAWPGAATPGVKVLWLIDESSAVTGPGLSEMMNRLAHTRGVSAARISRVVDSLVAGPKLQFVAELWFESQLALDNATPYALDHAALAPSGLAGPGIVSFCAVEYRLHPNPNHGGFTGYEPHHSEHV